MKFCNFLLRVNGVREASIDDFRTIIQIGNRTYRPEHQKYLYSINMDIIDNRFFWMSCDYDDAKSFRNYVVNRESGEKQPNPRTKDQIEPRLQFFACYDCETHFLYLNDINRKGFLQKYLSDTTQCEFQINNIYASVDEFCSKIKSLRGFQYTQVDNLFGQGSDIFSQVGTIWGQDLPSRVQLKISYNDLPMHKGGRGIVDCFARKKEEFENVVIIGCDDEGIEHTFDFSSVLKHLIISPTKDENEHYNPDEVRDLLLSDLR